MNMKNHFVLMRGDTHQFKFPRRDNNGQPILSPADRVYFTVKASTRQSNPSLQKTIEDMTFDAETGYYTFTIKPSDTDGLEVRRYVYDIEVMVGCDYVRTISEGTIDLVADVTLPQNEVIPNGTNN